MSEAMDGVACLGLNAFCVKTGECAPCVRDNLIP